MDGEVVFHDVALVFQLAGAAAMVVGVCVAAAVAVAARRRTGSTARAFTVLRETMGSAILLGLEILVAADLIRTVTADPSLTDVVVLAVVVLIRTGLSFSLQVEIDGVVPWRRALLPAHRRPGDRTDAPS